MSADMDDNFSVQQSSSKVSLHEHNLESDYSTKLAHDIKKYSHSAAIEAVNSMNRELQALYDKYLELGVRSHLLEVDLATQFSPDMVLAVKELNENCSVCSHAVEDALHCSESTKIQEESSLGNNIHEEV